MLALISLSTQLVIKVSTSRHSGSLQPLTVLDSTLNVAVGGVTEEYGVNIQSSSTFPFSFLIQKEKKYWHTRLFLTVLNVTEIRKQHCHRYSDSNIEQKIIANILVTEKKS